MNMETAPQEHNSEKMEREQLIEKIYQAALAQHKKFKEFPKAELCGTIQSALEEIDQLELAADPQNVKKTLTPEIAGNLSALWVFSGPGTYDSAKKDDRYRQYEWAEWMDHDRLSYAGWLARISAELAATGENPHGPIGESGKRKSEAKDMMGKYGPAIIYNGSEIENKAAKEASTREGVIVPKSKLHVVGEDIKRTTDQVKTFVLPENLHRKGGEIGLVSHAPQLMRILHMLHHYPRAIPKDMKLRLFPIASPTKGREDYAILEIKGLLYYIYLSPTRDAEKESYPYTIHGKKEK